MSRAGRPRAWPALEQASGFMNPKAIQTLSFDESFSIQHPEMLDPSAIAKEVTGGKLNYNHIFEANRDKLSDPDKIQVGQKLTIPTR